MSSSDRTYPLRKPENHRLPVPRYTLKLGQDIETIHTLYVGVQQHSDDEVVSKAAIQALSSIEKIFKSDVGPSALEYFVHIEGQDAPNTKSWVGYWTSTTSYEKCLDTLNLTSIHSSLPSETRTSIGLWLETFTTLPSRLETNYSGLDYLPGLARLHNTTTEEHDLATYWGAARDRIPDSAHDLFPTPILEAEKEKTPLKGLGQHITGTNSENMVHIRSGQFWQTCSAVESTAYESKLEPVLRAGLRWLREYPQESGATAVRYLRNTSSSHSLLHNQATGDEQRKETCGAAFFRNLSDLEKWAKGHKSHLAIYGGALKHYKAFPENRMMRTWHEVSVLRKGDARFEYVNCGEGTGAMDGMSGLDVRCM